MKTFYWIIAIIGLFFVIAWGYSSSRLDNSPLNGNNLGANMDNLNIGSTAFEDGGLIPIKYSCDGDNVSPPLTITDVPAETQSLALVMTDPDIPESVKQSRGIDVFDHWVAWNIPAETTVIPEEADIGVAGSNTAGNTGYTGPCPPDREHRYFFRVYALDTTLDLDEGSTREELEEAVEGHIIEQAELMGRFERFAEK